MSGPDVGPAQPPVGPGVGPAQPPVRPGVGPAQPPVQGPPWGSFLVGVQQLGLEGDH